MNILIKKINILYEYMLTIFRYFFIKIMVALKRAGSFPLNEKGNVYCLLGSLVGLLGKENSLDVGENSTLSNGDTSKKLVQLFVVSDGKL